MNNESKLKLNKLIVGGEVIYNFRKSISTTNLYILWRFKEKEILLKVAKFKYIWCSQGDKTNLYDENVIVIHQQINLYITNIFNFFL